MKYGKFSPSTKTPDQMMQQSQATENGITANPLVLPAPPVTVLALAAQRAIVNTKQTELNDARLLVETKAGETARESQKLGSLLLQECNYADGLAIADPTNAETILNKAGFPIKNAPVHHGSKPPAVHGFSVTLGDVSSNSDLHWDAQAATTTLYKIYYNVTDPTAPFDQATWKLGDSVNISSVTLKGLPIHVPIAFCVLGHNTNGDGDPSNIIVKTLL